jgi:hypothetical protein
MPDDGMQVLTRKVDELTVVTARLDDSTQRLTWVLSDENVGVVKQLRDIALVVKELEKSRDNHEARMEAQESRHRTEDGHSAEIRQPAIASFFSLVEKLLFLVISVALGWLWAIKK